jgi:hypothetical protein
MIRENHIHNASTVKWYYIQTDYTQPQTSLEAIRDVITSSRFRYGLRKVEIQHEKSARNPQVVIFKSNLYTAKDVEAFLIDTFPDTPIECWEKYWKYTTIK